MVGKKKKIKYYGVRKSHIPGIYNDWLEAQEQVNGFPGAEVQSFTNKKEAQAYMKSMNKSTNTNSTFIQAKNCTCQEETSQEESGHSQTDNMAPDAEDDEEYITVDEVTKLTEFEENIKSDKKEIANLWNYFDILLDMLSDETNKQIRNQCKDLSPQVVRVTTLPVIKTPITSCLHHGMSSADSPVNQSISTPQSSEVPQQTEVFIAARNQLYDEKIQLEEGNRLISKENARQLWPKAIYEVAQIQHGAEKLEDDGWVQPEKTANKEFIDMKSHSLVSDNRYSPLRDLGDNKTEFSSNQAFNSRRNSIANSRNDTQIDGISASNKQVKKQARNSVVIVGDGII